MKCKVIHFNLTLLDSPRCSNVAGTRFHKLVAPTHSDDITRGIALFVANIINFTLREDHIAFLPHVHAPLFVELSKAHNITNQIVGIIYRPNTQSRADIDIFSSTLQEVLDLINAEQMRDTICGSL